MIFFFFQSSNGHAVENLSLSAKYFVAESGITSACLACHSGEVRGVWHFSFSLERQLKFHCIFNLIYFPVKLYPSVSLWVHKCCKRLRYDCVAEVHEVSVVDLSLCICGA